MYRQFARIFETFRISEPEKSEEASKGQLQKEPIRELELKKVPKLEDEYEEEEEEEEVRSFLDVIELHFVQCDDMSVYIFYSVLIHVVHFLPCLDMSVYILHSGLIFIFTSMKSFVL
jgi:hypothetical protein